MFSFIIRYSSYNYSYQCEADGIVDAIDMFLNAYPMFNLNHINKIERY